MCLIKQFFVRKIFYICTERLEPTKRETEGNTIMAVGARDHIDKLLVQKYQSLQVDNHNNINQIDEEEMLSKMETVAQDKLSMMKYQEKLSHLGKTLLAKSAYKHYRYIPVR